MQMSVAASTMWPIYRGLAFCLWLDASFCSTQWTLYLPAGSCYKSTALRSALGDVRFYLSDRWMGRKAMSYSLTEAQNHVLPTSTKFLKVRNQPATSTSGIPILFNNLLASLLNLFIYNHPYNRLR